MDYYFFEICQIIVIEKDIHFDSFMKYFVNKLPSKKIPCLHFLISLHNS